MKRGRGGKRRFAVGRRRKRRNSNAIVNIDPSSTKYLGPPRLPRAKSANETYTAQLVYVGTLSTNGSGVLAAVLDSYAQASSATDWSNFTGMWSEYRILSMKTKAVPWNKYNTPTTTTKAPLYSVLDRSSGNALTSLADVGGYDTAMIHSPSENWTRQIKMDGTDEANFVDVASSTPTNSRLFIKLFSTGNTPSTTLYDYMTFIMVQFRCRK